MAIVSNFNEKDEDEKQSSTAPTISSGQAGIATAAAPSSSPKGTASGRFTNVQSYLNANKNEKIGSDISGKIDTEAGKLKNETQTQQSAFASRLPTQDKDFLGNVSTGNVDFTNTATQDQIKAVQNSANTQGLDPSLNTGVKYLNTTSSLAQSPGGQFEMLKQYFGRPSYNRGQQNLDYMLLNTDPTQAQAVRNSAIAAGNQASNTANAVTDANNSLAALGQYRTDLNTNLGTAKGSLEGVQTARNTNIDNFKAALSGGDIATADSLAKVLGIDTGTYRNWKGELNTNVQGDPSKYYTADTSIGAALSPTQLAQYNALQGLLGGEALTGSFNSAINVGDILSDIAGPVADVQETISNASPSGVRDRVGGSFGGVNVAENVYQPPATTTPQDILTDRYNNKPIGTTNSQTPSTKDLLTDRQRRRL
jgi:hypothetical protein